MELHPDRYSYFHCGKNLRGQSWSFTITSGNTVPAQGYFVLGYCRQPPAVDLVYGTTASIQLSNPGDTVTFRTDTLIDRVAPASGVGETASLSRKFSGSQPEPDQLGEEHPYFEEHPVL